MSRLQRPITDRELKAWLAVGAVDRGVGEGLTFVASAPAAQAGKASWILRFRLNGRSKEKVLGRYPELSLKDAREQARQDRVRIEHGVDVAAAKQAEKALVLEVPTVQRLGEVWFARYIQPRYKHPEVVARVLRKHINPLLGPVAPPDVKPVHIDRVLDGGTVVILSRGFGNCRISSTAARHVWRVQYFNNMQTLILNTIEVVAMPEVAVAAREDLVESHARLAELVQWMSDSIATA